MRLSSKELRQGHNHVWVSLAPGRKTGPRAVLARQINDRVAFSDAWTPAKHGVSFVADADAGSLIPTLPYAGTKEPGSRPISAYPAIRFRNTVTEMEARSKMPHPFNPGASYEYLCGKSVSRRYRRGVAGSLQCFRASQQSHHSQGQVQRRTTWLRFR